jgi:phytoene dehydrogenase-like protein
MSWSLLAVHAPARTDPTACPPGHDAVMVLVPAPVLGPNEGPNTPGVRERMEALEAAAREAVLRRIESVPGMEDFRWAVGR